MHVILTLIICQLILDVNIVAATKSATTELLRFRPRIYRIKREWREANPRLCLFSSYYQSKSRSFLSLISRPNHSLFLTEGWKTLVFKRDSLLLGSDLWPFRYWVPSNMFVFLEILANYSLLSLNNIQSSQVLFYERFLCPAKFCRCIQIFMIIIILSSKLIRSNFD